MVLTLLFTLKEFTIKQEGNTNKNYNISMGNKRGRKRSRKRNVSTIFKRKTFHGNRYTLKLPSEFIPESRQNTPLEASTSSYQSRVSQKLQLSRQSSGEQQKIYLPRYRQGNVINHHIF